MVKIEGYLSQEDIHELIHFFWSKRLNGVDRPTNEAYQKVVDALEDLEKVRFPKNEQIAKEQRF